MPFIGDVGVELFGSGVGDLTGRSVSSAGDINGDGFEDLIVGAPFADGSYSNNGKAYVVFGKAVGFADMDLGALAPADGFVIDGGSRWLAGASVSGGGDINGDGIDDLIVGAPHDPTGGTYAGGVFVVFGKTTGLGTVDLTAPLGANGCAIVGDGFDLAGSSVASAGDVNGDGIGDLILAGSNDSARPPTVIFGKSGGFGTIDLATLAPAEGFTMVQEGASYDFSVSSAGDFNGDGIDDLLVGDPDVDGGAGAVYLVYGRTGGFGTIDLAALAAADGVRIDPSASYDVGDSVASCDINGDGYADLIIGSTTVGYSAMAQGTTQAYVIFGNAAGTAAIAPGTGFRVTFHANVQLSTGVENVSTVAGAGDVNGDGFEDVIVGSAELDCAFVLYGRESWASDGYDFGASHTPFGSSVLALYGENYTAAGGSVSGADVNGDGFWDALIGAEDGGPDVQGAAHLVFGAAPTSDVHRIGSIIGQTIRGGSGNDILEGRAGDDILIGSDGNDRLEGGSGLDEMFGGGGDDTYEVDDAADDVVEDPGEGTDTVESSISILLGNNVENLTLTGTAAINGTGNSGANVIIGNDAANTLNGAGGADVMEGGDGDDVYLVLGGGATVSETSSTGGTDRVESYVSFTLGDNFENLTLASTGTAATATGNELANIIVGNFQNNTLDGGAGADTMDGSGGNDVYIVDDAGDVAAETPTGGGGTDLVQSSVNHILGGDIEDLTLTGTAASGRGNALNNVITGNSAANVLDGDAGADSMAGKTGNDRYVVDHIDDLTDETDDAFGYDRVSSSVSHTLQANVERLDLTGAAAIAGTGNGLANVIVGNDAANTLSGGGENDSLDGGLGADAMLGGVGNDLYYVDDAGDTLNENALEGSDHVQSSISHALGANFEVLTLTGTAAINGTGNSAANLLYGNAGANTLNGGGGGDTMQGGGGDDVYLVLSAADTVSEALSTDGTDRVESYVNFTLGAHVENLTLASTGTAALATGNALDNVILGNLQANILDGGAGADTMDGSGGNDVYIIDDAGDIVAEAGGGGTDEVRTLVTHTLGDNFENLRLQGTGAINGFGNTQSNEIRGNSGANTIDGREGADTMRGGLGNDFYEVDDAGDVATESAGEGNDTVRSSVSFTIGAAIELLRLSGTAAINGTGNAGANFIFGNDSDNILNGAGGADYMEGGAGNDTYVVDDGGEAVVEAASGGNDTVESNQSFTLADNIEYLTLRGTGDIDGTGNGSDNQLSGNSGANRLDGGAGYDFMAGGDGDDVYVVRDQGEFPNEVSSAGGVDTVETFVSTSLGNNIENLTMVGSAAINGSGNALSNIITGNAAANVVDGGAGADSLRGGAGNDTYLVEDAGDAVIELGGAGMDEVESSVSFALAANIEILQLTGAGDTDATGNALANTLHGNSGVNRLDGRAGADTMYGGGGDDLYIVDDSADLVSDGSGTDRIWSSASYVLTGQSIEILRLTGTSALAATGDFLDNQIYGNSGANRIDGGGGTDRMQGGGGADTYVVSDSGDFVIEGVGGGSDTVESAVTFRLAANLERLVLTGTSAINAFGNADANLLTGNAAANLLDGAGGADAMDGGAGDDTYRIDHAADAVVEAAGGGLDRVFAAVDHTLGDNLEQLQLTGAAMSGTGNALANIIGGTGGDNRLDGAAGADVMRGGSGDDTYVVDEAGDRALEADSSGSDRVESGVSTILGPNIETLILTGTDSIDGAGNALDNIIVGNTGANRLDGRAGADILLGDAGDDTYIVDDAADSVSESAGGGDDTIRSSISLALGGEVERLTLIGAAAIDATGNALANVLTGNASANRMDGGEGADELTGGRGDDVYVIDHGGDTVTEGAGGGVDLTEAAVDFALAANVENLILTGAALRGTGNALANDITGNALGNRLDGRAGADRLTGLGGNDAYLVDHRSDEIVEADGGGSDRLIASASYALAEGVHVETLSTDSNTGTAAIALGGNGLANSLVGNAGANRLDGGGGIDTMSGLGGGDAYFVDDAQDRVVERAGGGDDLVLASVSYRLAAGTEVESLRAADLAGTAALALGGNALDNAVVGNDGANRIDGGAGADRMEGRGGDDVYLVDDAGDRVIEAASGGTDTVLSSVSHALSGGAENLVLAGSASSGTGNALANRIRGNQANNVLDGGEGADRLMGGAGDDAYFVDRSNDEVVERAGDGLDVVRSTASYALGASIEALILLRSENIDATGNGLDNSLTGNAGANRLDGRAGADRMRGGAGDDIYVVDGAGDRAVELDGGGSDRVDSAISYVLGANLEALVLTGNGDTGGTGNALANLLAGNGGANRLDGRGGADLMRGGDGNDVYIVGESSDQVVERAGQGRDLVESAISFRLGADVEDLRLAGSAALDGTGNALANDIEGNSAANRLDGRGGADRLAGGRGDDIYLVDDIGDTLVEDEAAGADRVESSVSYALSDHLETLVLRGPAALDGTGNAGANTIIGNGGTNRLDGGLGDDLLIGGAGNDTYVVEGFGDTIEERGAGGVDTVLSSGSYSLGAAVEHLVLIGGATDGIGNGLANSITGNDGINVLDGAGGDDLLDGQGGLDIMKGGAGNDTFIIDDIRDFALERAGGGTDTMRSSVTIALEAEVENLVLTGTRAIAGSGNADGNRMTGNSGANRLSGADGNDHIDGGAGNDRLIGGDGADSFLFASALGPRNVDELADFAQGEDRLLLDRSIFGGITADGMLGEDAFHVGASAADAEDRIVYNSQTGELFYDADGTGGAAAILFARLDAGTLLSQSDILAYSASVPG